MSLTAGLGFKTEHLAEVLVSRDPGLWFEVHAENYMGDGGPRRVALAFLQACAEGRTLGEAALAATGADLAELFSTLITAGAFA